MLPSFFQRELPLLTWPHLAQRPLRSADSAGNSIFSSTLGISIAALQPCSSMCGVSSKNVCGLHQVRFLRMLIPVRPHADSAWQAKLFRCASFMQAQLCLQSMPRAIRPVLSLMVLNICHAAFCCFVLARHARKLRCHIPLSISHSRSHSQNNSKSGISHSYPGIT